MSVTDYVFRYHAIISIPTLIAIAAVHYFWQKHLDKRAESDMSYAEELDRYSSGDSKQQAEAPAYKGFTGVLYSILPLLPIILLLVVFFVNIATGKTYNISVQLVSLISFAVAVIVEMVTKHQLQSVLKETSAFFKGMGDVMSVVALLVSASVFVQGLTSIGIIQMIQTSMQHVGGSGVILPLIMVVFTAIIVLLSGSGTALIFAMIPLIVPLSKAAGIEPQALAIPMQLAGNLLRAVSPVAAVVLIVAGTTKLEPLQIVKRTSVPMVFGTVMMLVLSLLVF